MNYNEFLDKYSKEIENLDFENPVFSEFYGTDLWKKFLSDLEKLGINPLIEMKKIPDGFFRLCNITKINIPNNITSIGDYVFAGEWDNPMQLTSVTIPDSVTSIGYRAFEYCTKLTSITIGNSVTSIGYRAFFCCFSLTGIEIPDSLTSIGRDVFWGCDNLKKITFKGLKNQFKSIKKGYSWKPVGSFEVECTDGILIYK